MFHFNPKFSGNLDEVEVYLNSFPLEYILKYHDKILNHLILELNSLDSEYKTSKKLNLVFNSHDFDLKRQPENTCPMIDKSLQEIKSEMQDIDDEIDNLMALIEDEEGELKDNLEEAHEDAEEAMEAIKHLKEQFEDYDPQDPQDSITEDIYNEHLEELENKLALSNDHISKYEEEIENREYNCEYQDKIDDLVEKKESLEELTLLGESLRDFCERERTRGEDARLNFFSMLRFLKINYLSDKYYIFKEDRKNKELKVRNYTQQDFEYPDSFLDYFDEAFDNYELIKDWARQFEDLDVYQEFVVDINQYDNRIMSQERAEAYIVKFLDNYLFYRSDAENPERLLDAS